MLFKSTACWELDACRECYFQRGIVNPPPPFGTEAPLSSIIQVESNSVRTAPATLRARLILFATLLVWLGSFRMNAASADPVTVRFAQGMVHGFLVLQTLDGNAIADGDLTQIASGGHITGHLVFHFRDGSLYDETFIFTQRGTFRLLSEHLIQKGPSFKRPTELSINVATGQVSVRYTDDDGSNT